MCIFSKPGVNCCHDPVCGGLLAVGVVKALGPFLGSAAIGHNQDLEPGLHLAQKYGSKEHQLPGEQGNQQGSKGSQNPAQHRERPKIEAQPARY